MSAALQELVQAMATQHPEAHPYTLALLVQVQHGRLISGQEVRRMLSTTTLPSMPIQIRAERLGLSQPSTSEP